MNIKDLIGCVEGFMNPAESHLESLSELQRVTERERLSKAGQRSHEQKKGLFQARSPPFGGHKGLLGGLPHLPLGDGKPNVADYLIGIEQKILD